MFNSRFRLTLFYEKFLFLNGISIVVVTNNWLTTYVIYLTKLLMFDIIVLSNMMCSQCLVYIILCIKSGKYMSVSKIKDISFIKHLRKHLIKTTNLKHYIVCNLGSNFILFMIHALLLFHLNVVKW